MSHAAWTVCPIVSVCLLAATLDPASNGADQDDVWEGKTTMTQRTKSPDRKRYLREEQGGLVW